MRSTGLYMPTNKKCVMKKILFLHGFYASGQCVPALALRESFEGRAEVSTPLCPNEKPTNAHLGSFPTGK